MRVPGHYDPASTDTGAAAGTCGRWPKDAPDGRPPRRYSVSQGAPKAEDPAGWTKVLAAIHDYQTRAKR